jgi:hypothetical protein
VEQVGNELWHRPEFKDRRRELITKAEAATRAKVPATSISTWTKRYPDFPATVLSFTDKAARYIPAVEFDEWHAKFMASRGARGEDRLVARRVLSDWELPTTRAEQRGKLAELRAKRQAAIERIAGYDAKIDKILDALAARDEESPPPEIPDQ